MDSESLKSDSLVTNQHGRIVSGAELKPIKNKFWGQIWPGDNFWPFGWDEQQISSRICGQTEMRMPIVFIAVCICILFEEAAWEIKWYQTHAATRVDSDGGVTFNVPWAGSHRWKVQKKPLIITAWIVSLACRTIYSFILTHHSNRVQVLLNSECRIRATFQNLRVMNATGSTYRKHCKQ